MTICFLSTMKMTKFSLYLCLLYLSAIYLNFYGFNDVWETRHFPTVIIRDEGVVYRWAQENLKIKKVSCSSKKTSKGPIIRFAHITKNYAPHFQNQRCINSYSSIVHRHDFLSIATESAECLFPSSSILRAHLQYICTTPSSMATMLWAPLSYICTIHNIRYSYSFSSSSIL